MNSFIKYKPESLSDHKAFVEHLLSIIDTKMQFVKYRTNALIASFASTPSIHTDSCNSTFIKNPDHPDGQYISPENEKLLLQIEEYSKTTSLLLILRTRLSKQNLSLIYDLLSNDRYMEYDNDSLKKLLDAANHP